MSRSRILIVVALVIAFVVIVGVVINVFRHTGGENRDFFLTVSGGKSMTPSELKVNQYDRITIRVTSDQEGEVHLHEYDIAFNVKPGETTQHSFLADKTCSCEMEWEETSTPLGTLTVSP